MIRATCTWRLGQDRFGRETEIPVSDHPPRACQRRLERLVRIDQISGDLGQDQRLGAPTLAPERDRHIWALRYADQRAEGVRRAQARLQASGVAGGLAIYVQEDAAGRIVSNATRIEARRAYTMDDPFVRVSSHSIAAGGPSTATSGSQASATQNFEISRPNLTGSQAAQIANSVRQAAQRHGYVLEVEMEGDTTTSPRMALNLSGTGTNMDGGYKIDMVTRHFSFTGGFSQHIRAVTPDQGGASAPGPQTDPDVGLPQDDGDPQEPP